MPAFKRKDGTGQPVQAAPALYIMRMAQTTPLSLPQWVLAAYKDGRMSFSLEAVFIRQNPDKSDEPVKYPNSFWIVETGPNQLTGMGMDAFTATYEPVT